MSKENKLMVQRLNHAAILVSSHFLESEARSCVHILPKVTVSHRIRDAYHLVHKLRLRS